MWELNFKSKGDDVLEAVQGGIKKICGGWRVYSRLVFCYSTHTFVLNLFDSCWLVNMKNITRFYERNSRHKTDICNSVESGIYASLIWPFVSRIWCSSLFCVRESNTTPVTPATVFNVSIYVHQWKRNENNRLFRATYFLGPVVIQPICDCLFH